MSRLTACFVAALCAGVTLPAAGQVGGTPPAANPLGLRAGDSGWMTRVFVGGQGFNADRARMADPGFRLPATGTPPSSSAAAPPPGQVALPPYTGHQFDPSSAAQAGAYVGYRRDSWTVSSGVRQGVGAAAGGTRLDLAASYGFNVTPRHLISLSGGLTLGASAPALPYYAMYGTDAFWRSGYRAGEPGLGLRLSWLYRFDRSTAYFATTLGFDRAYGDAEGLQGLDRNTTTFGTTFGYRW
jgi:hypothetical protein